MAGKNAIGITAEEILARQRENTNYLESGKLDYMAAMMDMPDVAREQAGKTSIVKDLSEQAEEENKIVEIPLDLVEPSRMNTFRAYPEETFEELKASIDANGLLMPIIVRPAECCETYSIDAEFEIISGEHRYLAHKELGLDSIRCAIYKVDDVTASLIIGQTNIQREASEIEVAMNYRKTYELMKNTHGGDRKSAEFEDEKSSSHGENLIENDRTLDVLAGRYGISRPTMHRKIRLTYLTDEVLDKYQKGKLTQEQAVKISYGNEDAQNFLMTDFYSGSNKNWIDDDRASKFAEAARAAGGRLQPNVIRKIMEPEDADSSGDDEKGKNKDRKYIVPTYLFPKDVKLKERSLYIQEALKYIKTHNIELRYKDDVERDTEIDI